MSAETIKPLLIDGMEPVYSLESTAAMFGKSKKTIRRWVRAGILTAKRNGPELGNIVFYRKDIEAFRSKPVRG